MSSLVQNIIIPTIFKRLAGSSNPARLRLQHEHHTVSRLERQKCLMTWTNERANERRGWVGLPAVMIISRDGNAAITSSFFQLETFYFPSLSICFAEIDANAVDISQGKELNELKFLCEIKFPASSSSSTLEWWRQGGALMEDEDWGQQLFFSGRRRRRRERGANY